MSVFKKITLEGMEQLGAVGQSLWMSHVSRGSFRERSLTDHIEYLSVTGAALSFKAMCQALSCSEVYDVSIYDKLKEGVFGEPLAIDLILDDVRHAADQLRHVYESTDSVNGWAALPLLPQPTDTEEALPQEISALYARMNRPNILITIPGLPEMMEAIEEIIFSGIPINISQIYSSDQYLKVAGTYLCGIERRISAGLTPVVPAFVSIPISRLATEISKTLTETEATQTALDSAKDIFRAMSVLHTTQSWERINCKGARPLRVVWQACDDDSSAGLTHELFNNITAPFTVMMMSERIMGEFSKHQGLRLPMTRDMVDGEDFPVETDNSTNLAREMQKSGQADQTKSWIMLLEALARKSASIIGNVK